MTDHTQLPWKNDGDGLRALVRGADETIVALRHRLPREVHEANFALIVKAVNNHERMVEALRRIGAHDGGYAGDIARDALADLIAGKHP